MKPPVTPRKAEFERLQFVRWVLFLVVAARAAGMRELDRERLHALLFHSFASSLFYGIAPLRQRAQRTNHGPYYRAAHLAVGRLVLGGLVSLSDYNPLEHDHGLQFDGNLSPTAAGLDVAMVLRQTNRGEQLYRFVLDLCLGMVRAVSMDVADASADGAQHTVINTDAQELVAQSDIDRVLHRDLSYRQAEDRHEALMPMVQGPDEEPLTVHGLRDIERAITEGQARNRRDVLTAYQYLLRRRAA